MRAVTDRADTLSMRKSAAEIRRSLAAMPRKNAASFRVIRREWSRRLKSSSGASVILLGKRLAPLGFWERVFAYELIACHRAAQEAITREDVISLGRGMEGWGEADAFSGYIAGPAWRDGKISDKTVCAWTRSRDRWWRRAALASTVPLNRRPAGGSGNTLRTLKVCRMLVRDRDDMVVKALSWALRELSRRNPSAVEAFLKRNDHLLAARVRREVTNKLRTGLKNPCRGSGPRRQDPGLG